MLKKVLIGLGVLFLLIQLIPVDRSNPPVTREIAWDSAETRSRAGWSNLRGWTTLKQTKPHTTKNINFVNSSVYILCTTCPQTVSTCILGEN